MGGYGFLHHVNLEGKELEWDKEEVDEDAILKLLTHRKAKAEDKLSTRRRRLKN